MIKTLLKETLNKRIKKYRTKIKKTNSYGYKKISTGMGTEV